MAEPGTTIEGATGQWGTVSFEIPDFLAEIRDTINDFAELLVAFLEIANQALEFAKAFVKGYIDPMTVLIEAIIAEVAALLQSLKGIGLYLTGDWALLGWPPEDLRGGFQGYEQRMVARLTDRTDPTRPDIASTTKVLGFFGYLSVDPSDFERLVGFIVSLGRLFGLNFFPDTSRLPVPNIKSIKYAQQALGVGTALQFSALGDALSSWSGTPPQKCSISWVAQPASLKHPGNPFPVVGPSGYLVTVSTVPDGLALKYARARANTDKKPAGGNQAKQVQPREYGDVRDPSGLPLKLYGGAEMLAFEHSAFRYNDGIDPATGTLKDGACQVFGRLDPATDDIIPLEDLGPRSTSLGVPGDGNGSSYFLQRTFLITDGVTLAQWFSGEYHAVLDVKDMPHHARWEKTPSGRMQRVDLGRPLYYYVRVWSVGKTVAEERSVPQWDFLTPVFQASTAGQPFVVNLASGAASLGNPSAARKVTFVQDNTQEYLRALQTALLVLVLSRADLPTLDEIEATKGTAAAQKYRDGKWAAAGFAKTATGLESVRGLLQRIYSDIKSLEVPGQSPGKWRSDLYSSIRALSYELYAKTGTNARIEKLVVDASVQLRAATWGSLLKAGATQAVNNSWTAYLKSNDLEDPLLFEALNPDNPMGRDPRYGLAPNPFSVGMEPNDVDDLFYVPGVLQCRESDFTLYDGGSLDLVFEAADPLVALRTINAAPEGLRRVYQMFLRADGSLHVPDEFRAYLTAKKKDKRVSSSGDLTPVFAVNVPELLDLEKGDDLSKPAVKDSFPALVFTRGLIRAATGAPLFAQAALVLQAAATERPPGDGEWVALRLFDTWPELEDFLRSLENWTDSLAEAARSIADALVKYIEFVQAQIVELQQLIRRINALLQSFLNFSIALPQFSGLMLVSDGTDGLLADLVTATNKPSDPPLSYGGGIALVAPFAPGFLLDLIRVAASAEDEPATQDLDAATGTDRPPPPVGTEGAPPGVPPPDDDPL